MGISGCCNIQETSGNKIDNNIIMKNNSKNNNNHIINSKDNIINDIDENNAKESDSKDINSSENNSRKKEVEIEEEGDGDNMNKIIGYNTTQKIKELKYYRFFLDNLYTLMMINNGLEIKTFYFIRKNWVKSWYKYVCYEKIKPLLVKHEINNEIDFHKIIIDHKKELNFHGFTEREKPNKIQFFLINKMNTNINENFYIFDELILKKFADCYGIDENNEKKEF